MTSTQAPEPAPVDLPDRCAKCGEPIVVGDFGAWNHGEPSRYYGHVADPGKAWATYCRKRLAWMRARAAAREEGATR